MVSQPGVNELDVLPPNCQSLDRVRDQNLKLLKATAPMARLILIKRLGAAADSLRSWRDPDDLESRLAGLANAGGWIDFDLLDEAAMLGWLERSAQWPAGLPRSLTLSDHGLTRNDIDVLKAAERKARELVLNPPRILKYSGGDFVIGQTSLAAVTHQINDLAQSNADLLALSTKTAREIATVPRPPGGGGGGGSGGYGNSTSRMKVIGYFGEATAFASLKTKFGRNRVVDYGAGSRSIASTRVARKAKTGSDTFLRSKAEEPHGSSKSRRRRLPIPATSG